MYFNCVSHIVYEFMDQTADGAIYRDENTEINTKTKMNIQHNYSKWRLCVSTFCIKKDAAYSFYTGYWDKCRVHNLPNNKSFNSLLASLLSFRSCFSISVLIRFCSFASSLRQHAIFISTQPYFNSGRAISLSCLTLIRPGG